MASIEKRQAKNWLKCCCCGEQVRTCESYFQVVNDNGRDRRGERYCKGCESYAYENNDDIDDDNDDDGERHLRQMEDYAAYRAAGCSHEYWNDRDAGYCE